MFPLGLSATTENVLWALDFAIQLVFIVLMCVRVFVRACVPDLWPRAVLTTVYIQLRNMVYGCVRSPLQLLDLNLERDRTINPPYH